MIITKEQQEAWVNAYIQEKHNTDECIGFIDGITKALDVVKNNIVLPDVMRSLPLQEFMDEVEYMQRLYSNQRYKKAEQVRDKLSEKLDDIMRVGGG